VKRFVISSLIGVFLALPAYSQDRPLAAASQSYVPRLGDIMGATQLRHIKLWYAGKEKNWPLAEYELGQIKESFQDAMTYYPGLPAANMTTMAKPASQIGNAIRTKNSTIFGRAFGELTAACNACHQAQGYGHIAIRVPTGSPFTDQTFSPK